MSHHDASPPVAPAADAPSPTSVPSAPRRASALAVLALATGLLTPLGPAATADAAEVPETCTDETQSLLPPVPGCDDVTPPDTALRSVSPRPVRGWSRSDRVTLGFAHVVTDGDPGPWSFRCRLEGPSQAHGWRPCTSPVTYTGLGDTSGTQTYRFSVYAVDDADSARVWQGSNLLSTADDEDTVGHPDDDSLSPATTTWRQDTRAPNTYLFDQPYDAISPGFPLVTGPRVPIQLASNEGRSGAPVTYRCTLSGRAVPCHGGTTSFGPLRPGDQTLRVAAVDAAGNLDPTPATTSWSVPVNLRTRQARGFSRKRGGGYLGRDYLLARKAGALVTVKVRRLEDLRLIAPAGPRIATLRWRIGGSRWRTIDTRARRYQRLKVYPLRLFDGAYTGSISIGVKQLRRGQTARVDGLLVH